MRTTTTRQGHVLEITREIEVVSTGYLQFPQRHDRFHSANKTRHFFMNTHTVLDLGSDFTRLSVHMYDHILSTQPLHSTYPWNTFYLM